MRTTARQTNKCGGFLQMFFDGCDGQGGRAKRREDGLRKTQGDNMGGTTRSVNRGKGWFGKCEVER